DVLIQDLEDFTPQQSKQAAREMSADLFTRARASGIIPAVRVNLLSGLGMIDLAAVVPARPDIILLPKAESAQQIAALTQEIERIKATKGRGRKIKFVPTAETALGVVNLKEIVQASSRVKSCVLGAEDLAADLMAVRTPQADELAYARSRFLLECRALGVEPIDPPYTYSDADGCERESHRSRQLAYRGNSPPTPPHINIIHRVFTPSPEEIDAARRLVAAFESARAKGQDRALVDGLWIEPPAYLNAQRVLERARRLDAINRAPTEHSMSPRISPLAQATSHLRF